MRPRPDALDRQRRDRISHPDAGEIDTQEHRRTMPQRLHRRGEVIAQAVTKGRGEPVRAIERNQRIERQRDAKI